MKLIDRFKKSISNRLGGEGIKVTGKWEIKCFDRQGNLQWVDSGKNLIVTSGLGHIADQMSAQSEAPMGYIAVGSGNTTPVAGDIALDSELTRVVIGSKTPNANQSVYVATFDPGVATGTWEEAGIFQVGAGGTMLNRLLTGTKVKAAGDSFNITITITYS